MHDYEALHRPGQAIDSSACQQREGNNENEGQRAMYVPEPEILALLGTTPSRWWSEIDSNAGKQVKAPHPISKGQ